MAPGSPDTNADSPSINPTSEPVDASSPSFGPSSGAESAPAAGDDSAGDDPMPDPSPDAYTIHAHIENDQGVLLVVEYESAPNYGGCKLLFFKDQTKRDILDETEGVLDPHFLRNHPTPTARFHPNDEGVKLACDMMGMNSAERLLIHRAVQSIDTND